PFFEIPSVPASVSLVVVEAGALPHGLVAALLAPPRGGPCHRTAPRVRPAISVLGFGAVGRAGKASESLAIVGREAVVGSCGVERFGVEEAWAAGLWGVGDVPHAP